MLDNIKHTLKHTAIYSLGNIATKLMGIVLLPLYVKHITVSEYGILGILEITIMILSQTLTLGQSQSFLRFYDLDEYKQKRKSVFFTIFVFLFFFGIFISLLGQSLVTTISSFFSKPDQFAVYFKLCIYIILLRVINNLFLSVLRAREKSALFVIGNIIKLITILGFNIYFIAYLKIGIKGILYSYLIGDGLLFLILLPRMISEITPKFDYKILTAALSFGVPLICGGLAHMLLEMGDRYILKLFVDYREVGLYNLGCRIAGVLSMFLIQSFQLSLMPISYKMYGKKGDKRYYSKMLTYFIFVLFWAGLGLSFFYKEIIEIFAKNTDYWEATVVVPYIILAYVFSGSKIIVNLGLYLKKKTNYIAYNTLGIVVLNIGLNFLLIPRYRMIGAAIARIISFLFLYFITYFVANHFYRIPYENKKLTKLLVLAITLYLLSTTMFNIELWLRIILKVCLLFSFPLILYPMNFYEEIEIQRIRQFIRRKII